MRLDNTWRVLLVTFVSALILSGCIDKTENVVLMNRDRTPFHCPNQQKTRWEFIAPVTVDGEIVYVDHDEEVLKANDEYIWGQLLFGYLAGGRIPWIQFRLFCGEEEAVFYDTHQLTEQDLVRNGDMGYIYFVDMGEAGH